MQQSSKARKLRQANVSSKVAYRQQKLGRLSAMEHLTGNRRQAPAMEGPQFLPAKRLISLKPAKAES
eukprot:925187-Pelagomonas_calceolata.AAC.2